MKPSLAAYTPGTIPAAADTATRKLRPCEAFARNYTALIKAQNRLAHGEKHAAVAKALRLPVRALTAVIKPSDIAWEQRRLVDFYLEEELTPTEIMAKMRLSLTDLNQLLPENQRITPPLAPVAAPAAAPAAHTGLLKQKNYSFAKDPAQVAEALYRRAHGEPGLETAAHFNIHFTTLYATITPEEVNQARRDYMEQYRQSGLTDDAIRQRLNVTEKKFAQLRDITPSGINRPVFDLSATAPAAAPSPAPVVAPAPAPVAATPAAPPPASNVWAGLTPGLPSDLVAYQQRTASPAPAPKPAVASAPAPATRHLAGNRRVRPENEHYATPGAILPGMGPFDCVKPGPDASGLRIAGSAIRYRAVRLIPDHVEDDEAAPPPPPTMGCTLMGDDTLHAKVMKRLVHGEPSREVAADYNLTVDDMRQYLDWKLLQEAKRRQLDAYRDEGVADNAICQRMRLNPQQFDALLALPAPAPVAPKTAPAPVAPPPACA